MSERFIIECNGIIDNWKPTNKGNLCEDRLSWRELCDTLNQLDELADENLDEYKLIVELSSEVEHLKQKLKEVRNHMVNMQDNLRKIGMVVDDD